MKTYVWRTTAAKYNVYDARSWGRVLSGFPRSGPSGIKIAEGFATAAEAIAWAKNWEEQA